MAEVALREPGGTRSFDPGCPKHRPGVVHERPSGHDSSGVYVLTFRGLFGRRTCRIGRSFFSSYWH